MSMFNEQYDHPYSCGGSSNRDAAIVQLLREILAELKVINKNTKQSGPDFRKTGIR